MVYCRLRLKCDCTRAETRFRLSAKRRSLFKSAGRSVQSTTGSRGVRISGSNGGYTMFRGGVKGTGYPLHSQVSPSLSLPASSCAITLQLDSTTCTWHITCSAERLDMHVTAVRWQQRSALFAHYPRALQILLAVKSDYPES
jgi:hypothetical protein